MTINEIISAYVEATEAKKEAEKRAEAMKAAILDAMKDADSIITDKYTVIVKTTQTTRIDTKALYHDFPDIKEAYGKTSLSRSLSVAQTPADAVRTA